MDVKSMVANLKKIGERLMDAITINFDDDEMMILEAVVEYLEDTYDREFTVDELIEDMDLDGNIQIGHSICFDDSQLDVVIDVKHLKMYKYVSWQHVETIEFEDKKTMEIFFKGADMSDVLELREDEEYYTNQGFVFA